MPVAPNQRHLHPETLQKIKKAKPPKRVEHGGYQSRWLTGENFKPPDTESKKVCPF